MFFQGATPDTSGYMIAGYLVAFIVMGLYVLSMYLRSRNLNQDMTMLEEMEKSAPLEKKVPTKAAESKSPGPVTKRNAEK